MTIRIDNVTGLGTGNLGSQIIYQTAYSGFDVIAYDINDKVLETGGGASRSSQRDTSKRSRARPTGQRRPR